MTALEAVRQDLPEAAKDVRLNLQAVLEQGSLTPQQKWGVAVASAIAARSARLRDAQVLGMSTDTHFVHLAWRRDHADLRNLPFPMLADTKRELSTALGILHRGEGVPLRATFIVDPQGVIRWASVNDLSVGRNVDEVVRVLDALQTGELCPCNWKAGEATLQVA